MKLAGFDHVKNIQRAQSSWGKTNKTWKSDFLCFETSAQLLENFIDPKKISVFPNS